MDKSEPPTPPPNRIRSIVSIVRPSRRRIWATAGLAVLAVAIIAIIIFLITRSGSGSAAGTAHLVLDSPDKNAVLVTNAAGKQLYKLNYPQYAYVNYEASSKGGELLLSLSISTPGENFILAASGKAQNLPADTVKDLHSAIVLDSSHHIFFTDENTVIYMDCPGMDSCKLVSLGLGSAKLKIIIDTGAKLASGQLPSVYPLGVSPDGKTIYIRTLATNKLGKDAAAVYAVSNSGKVTNSWPLSRDADYTPSLSPDAKQIVYRTGGNKSATTLSVLNLSSGKTYQAKWTSGEIADSTSAFSWAPDSKKVLIMGSNSLLPRLAFDSTFDTTIGYLDTSSSQITTIQTLKDSAHNRVNHLGFIDNNNIVYEQDSTTKTYDFTDPTIQIFKTNISSKTTAKISSLSGSLKQIIFY